MSRKIEEFELTAFALGEVDAETRVLIEAELLVNQEARELVEEIKKAAELVRVELGEGSDESGPALHPEQLARIERSARGPEQKANASDRARKPHRRGRVIAIASAVGLCAVAFFAVTSTMVMRASAPQAELVSVREVPVQSVIVSSKPEGASVQMQEQQGASANYLPGRAPSLLPSGRVGKVGGLEDNIELAPSDPTNAARFQRAPENDFHQTRLDRLSTFSIDVDTASYGIVRRYLSHWTTPPRDSIRVEEMINYFDWDLPPPKKDPIAIYADVTDAPWKSDHLLARVALKAKEIDQSDRKPMNLVFLIDVSGSMAPEDRLPLLKRALALFVPTLTERDRMAIVVYAGASGLVLPPTPGDRHREILAALDRLNAGGSTNGGAGIQLAYDTAVGAFISGGANRVVLATDGDFNVGVTSQQSLIQLIEAKARSNVFLTVLGFGMSNLNDAMLEQIADHGDGNYAYVDDLREAQRVLIEKAGSTLETIAKDVKVQIDFNPERVASYRLIGYENRLMAAHEFNNDAKDAGEMGSGHAVTMLYEIVPATGIPDKGDMFTVKVRYKAPEGGASREIQKGVGEKVGLYDRGREDLKFAAAIAELAMVLTESPHRGNATLQKARELAQAGLGGDPHGQRSELVQLILRAEAIARGPR